jgi:hypothetical protein
VIQAGDQLPIRYPTDGSASSHGGQQTPSSSYWSNSYLSSPVHDSYSHSLRRSTSHVTDSHGPDFHSGQTHNRDDDHRTDWPSPSIPVCCQEGLVSLPPSPDLPVRVTIPTAYPSTPDNSLGNRVAQFPLALPNDQAVPSNPVGASVPSAASLAPNALPTSYPIASAHWPDEAYQSAVAAHSLPYNLAQQSNPVQQSNLAQQNSTGVASGSDVAYHAQEIPVYATAQAMAPEQEFPTPSFSSPRSSEVPAHPASRSPASSARPGYQTPHYSAPEFYAPTGRLHQVLLHDGQILISSRAVLLRSNVSITVTLPPPPRFGGVVDIWVRNMSLTCSVTISAGDSTINEKNKCLTLAAQQTVVLLSVAGSWYTW